VLARFTQQRIALLEEFHEPLFLSGDAVCGALFVRCTRLCGGLFDQFAEVFLYRRNTLLQFA
jgi:hypothetical protein